MSLSKPVHAQVAVNRPLWTTYTYAVPASLASRMAVGCRVAVPFGRQEARGVVVALGCPPPPEGAAAREIQALLDPIPLLDQRLLDLGQWLSDYYLCPLGESLDAMTPAPAGRRNLEPSYRVCPGADPAVLSARARRLAELFAAIERVPAGLPRSEIVRLVPEGARQLRTLVDRGLVEVVGEPPQPVRRLAERTAPGRFHELTPDQARAFAAISSDIDSRARSAHLIHGITGSGKTEIYLHLIRRTREQGRGAIFLLPEISLTVPMMAVLRERFGEDVALLHSAQTPRERYGEWLAIARGEKGVVVGARSAIFAPLAEPGLIILDEESETSYKQQDRPCYHARDVARRRARLAGSVVVLGSATPSLETVHELRDGEQKSGSRYHRLTRRFNGLPLPAVRLIDMASEFSQRKNRSIFSMALKTELDRVLNEGGQALLFLNRRGHSTYVFCRACGEAIGCPSCSVTLTYHMATGRMLCHLCGREDSPPKACPKCSDPAIRYCGGGTQKVEEEFRVNFPAVEVCRMDSDTTSSRGSHARIIGDYAAGKTRVLVGTQMVAKGFDFPNLDLVGVVNADSVLHTNDFRSAERTFCILTQVAGRVGRGARPGLVLTQTYTPGHYALLAASRHDYDEFARLELPQRQVLGYPPFARLISLVAEAETEEGARTTLESVRAALAPVAGDHRVRVLGPAPAHVARVADRFRYSLLVKIPASPGELPDELTPAGLAVRQVIRAFAPPAKVALAVDVDPF